MNIAQKKAVAFIRKYRLTKKILNIDTMRNVLEQQGYFLLQFNALGRSSDTVESFLESRNLAKRIHDGKCKEGFTYIRGNDRVVLVDSRLSEENEIYVLLHEQGHISFNHLAYIPADKFQCEREADAFAFYVMHYLDLKNTFRKVALVGVVLLLVLYLVLILLLSVA